MSDASLPLAGIEIVEFSHMVMGPTCGLILADLGATVIKVEPVGSGDNTRRLPGSGAGYFASFNRNKHSLAVDLKSAEGLELVRSLIARSDVVTENFRPGAMDTLGLDHESLRRNNPGLIYCSLKGFLSGPYEHRVALDEVVQMMGGLAYMTGPTGRPLRAGAAVNDMMGGMFAAIGIMAALLERKQTGKGQLVRSALFENSAWLVAPHMAQAVITGQAPRPMPERVSAWAVYDVFPTADERSIFVGVVSDKQWRSFCEFFDLPDLLADESLKTNYARVMARDSFMPRLLALFAGMSSERAAALCEKAGLPFAPIVRPDELFDDPHLMQPGAMIPLRMPESSAAVNLPALPLEMDGERLGKRRDLPAAGESSVPVVQSLGYSEAEIADLLRRGVISAPPK